MSREQWMVSKGNDQSASDQEPSLPNVAPEPAPPPHTKQGLHPFLKQNRFAIRGKEMFALYPVGDVNCSDHSTRRSTRRNSLIAHVASPEHLDMEKMKLIYVCEACHVCYLYVGKMKKHFDAEHMDRATSSTATADLVTVCTYLIPETHAVCNPALKFPLDSPDVFEIGKLAYNTIEVLGEGSCGTLVYKGLFEKRDDVAVKRVQISPKVDAVKEIAHLRSLNHENIVKYYVTERDKYFTYIAITLAEASLNDFIKQRAKYPDIVINEFNIFSDCCNGLTYLHYHSEREWVLHRDIKPHNILLTKTISGESKAMLSDFGIAKKHSLDATQTRSTGTKGTRGWIAPEVLNSGEHSRSSDVFSMGCVAFFIFSGGQHPFGEENVRVYNIEKAEQPNMRPVAKSRYRDLLGHTFNALR